FANYKECIFKLSGFLTSLSSFLFEILIASFPHWRVWEFDDNIVQFVSLGLWEAHYPQEFNVSGTVIKMLVHTPINSNWTISPEIQYAQNLIVSAILMKPIVLVFSAMAIKISCMKEPFAEVEIYCYKISALVLGVSSLFTFVSVIWNHFVDHYGQTTFDFPPDFPVKKEALISKHNTAVFPLGVVTTIVALFGVTVFLSEISSLKLQSQVKSPNMAIVTDEEV
ncbi:hypothetical protein HispidOSU_029901, partial [Sigmodon hispidus]